MTKEEKALFKKLAYEIPLIRWSLTQLGMSLKDYFTIMEMLEMSKKKFK